MQYQRSWWSLYTGTSTTRSTWSLPWPACSSLQSCTAGPGAWSSAVMPSNLCWDTTPSSRLWLRKACTWPTRTDWWRREIWPARPYTWWVDVTIAEHVTENILIVLLVLKFYSSAFCMFTPKRFRKAHKHTVKLGLKSSIHCHYYALNAKNLQKMFTTISQSPRLCLQTVLNSIKLKHILFKMIENKNKSTDPLIWEAAATSCSINDSDQFVFHQQTN